MAFLEQFSEDEKSLIVALPYRVGVWVSSVDDVGGTKADYEELSELEKIIAEKSQGMFESAFVHEVMAETNMGQAKWREWAKELDSIPGECTKVVEIISAKLDEKDIDAYRANVMSIGLSVAKAFREFDAEASFFTKILINIRFFFEGVIRVLSRNKIYETEYDARTVYNISYEEDKALTKLSQALHPGLDARTDDAQISDS